MEPDFGGWATKANLKCSDGRTIMSGAFEHMDKMRVPLVWQHNIKDPENVLGHAILESRAEGVRMNAFFNDTPKAKNTKLLVEHGDITHLSIYANQLVEKNKNVIHGQIREVSLVVAGANPGACIDYVRVVHGDGSYDILDDVATIQIPFENDLTHGVTIEDDDEDDDFDDEVTHAEADDLTLEEVYNSLDPVQKDVVHYMVGVALEGTNAEHSDKPDENDLTHQEGADSMSRNVFDQTDANKGGEDTKHTLSHADIKGIFADAMKIGSLSGAVEAYTMKHGIDNIEILFPDAKSITSVPELDKRRTEWVATVLNGTRHTPFSRVKTLTADLTQDEARARGYIKGNYKAEEWIGVTKRTTTPTTVYKKQKLDRDDMLDITDFDIVSFLKSEMRLMLEEEIARAILIGDGRDVSSDDKIKDPLGASDGQGIRSIVNDNELYATTVNVNVDDADSTYDEVIDAVMDAMEFYKGTGTPTFFTTIRELNKFLKVKDADGRRIYRNKSEVAEALGVSSVVAVESMNEITDLIGIIVNLGDYNIGTDKGGEIALFDDFDIDYNQQKYLLETRMSGALVKVKAALIIKKTAASSILVAPTKPAFNATTGVITIPTKTGVTYKDSEGNTLSSGAMTALGEGVSKTIYSVANSGYHFATTAEDSWTFKRPVATP